MIAGMIMSKADDCREGAAHCHRLARRAAHNPVKAALLAAMRDRWIRRSEQADPGGEPFGLQGPLPADNPGMAAAGERPDGTAASLRDRARPLGPPFAIDILAGRRQPL